MARLLIDQKASVKASDVRAFSKSALWEQLRAHHSIRTRDPTSQMIKNDVKLNFKN